MRQLRHCDDAAGHHVGGDGAAQLFARGAHGYLLRRLDEEHYLLPGLVEHGADVLRAGEHTRRGLDLAQLYAVAAQLDLPVAAAGVHELAPLVPPAEVARAVIAGGIGGVVRVGGKGAGGLLGIVPVTEQYAAAGDADLARLAGPDSLPVLAEQQHVHVGQRRADGQRLRVGELAVHDVGRADVRLGGPVEVGEDAAGQGAAPDVELFVGHDLAGEGDGFQLGQLHAVERAGVGDVYHDRRHPVDVRDGVVAQEFGQLVREVEQRLGRQDQVAAAAHGAVDVHDRDVEVERGLVGDDRPACPAEGALGPAGEEQHAAVRDGDALGRAGGTGGVHYIYGVGVGDGFQRGVYFRTVMAASHQLVDEEHLIIAGYALQVPGQRLVGYDRRGGEVGDYLLQPAARGGGVGGHVGAAGIHGGAEASYHVHALGQVDHDGRARAELAYERAGRAAGSVAQLAVGEGGFSVADGLVVRPEPAGALQQADGRVHIFIPPRR